MAEISLTRSDAARAARRKGGEWFERLARVGFAASGVVYILVGAIAAAAAWGGRAAEGSEGALQRLLGEPLGRVLLAVIALGLAAYALWRFVSAFADPEREGAGHRLIHAGKGIVHAGLALEAARMALSGSGDGGGGEARASHWTARVMTQPLGEIAVAVAGAAVAGHGLRQIYRGFTADLDDQIDLGTLSASSARWTVRVACTGLAARGVVFGVIGVFLVHAALQSDPGEARGPGGALRALQQQPYGPWLLSVVALGLIAYGVYQLIRARYRRIARPA